MGGSFGSSVLKPSYGFVYLTFDHAPTELQKAMFKRTPPERLQRCTGIGLNTVYSIGLHSSTSTSREQAFHLMPDKGTFHADLRPTAINNDPHLKWYPPLSDQCRCELSHVRYSAHQQHEFQVIKALKSSDVITKKADKGNFLSP